MNRSDPYHSQTPRENAYNMATPASEMLVVSPGGPLVGEIGPIDQGDYAAPIGLPGDKSLSHRAALFAAMADGESRIENFLVSGVTEAMLGALKTLGVSWRLEGNTLYVQGVGLRNAAGGSPVNCGVTLDCGNSATTLRLLAGALAAWGAWATLDGTAGLRRRPMRRIAEPLQHMGIQIASQNGCAPLVVRSTPKPLRGLDYTLPIASAQVKSCLLLAALSGDAPSRLIEPGPSRDHTERMLRAMGVDVSNLPLDGGHWITRLIPPEPLRLAPLHMRLPGDISAAAFLIVAALITPGSQLTLRQVGLNPTRTGLLDTLQEMGADLCVTRLNEQGGEPVGDLTVCYSPLHGVQVGGERVVRMIDEFPVFAIAAACAHGETVVRDAQELRHKESDRISALGQELRLLGVDFTETPDGFVIRGGQPLSGGDVQSHGDHRLAMSLAISGLVAEQPVRVSGSEMINESFPEFAAVLRRLGANVLQSSLPI
jgi:3-phosphoshikimate 1-carboxyvinyltransferase